MLGVHTPEKVTVINCSSAWISIMQIFGRRVEMMKIHRKIHPALTALIDNLRARVGQNETNVDDITSALVELGELLAEQDDALVELAELIEEE